ncbi:MAG: STAS domain-containing protein [Solirubrobacterales bacterium]
MFRSLDSSSRTARSGAPAEDVGPSGALPVCAISVRRQRGWTAVMLRGELDYSAGNELLEAVRTELNEGRPVIVELVGLDFIDLNGARALTELVREGDRCCLGVELHGARDQVAGLMRMLGYGELLTDR